MKAEIITEMEAFCLRVLKGGESVNMQETAVLPKILEILKDLPGVSSGKPIITRINNRNFSQLVQQAMNDEKGRTMELTDIRKFVKEITRECEKRGYTFEDAELLANVLKDEIRQCKEANLKITFKALAE